MISTQRVRQLLYGAIRWVSLVSGGLFRKPGIKIILRYSMHFKAKEAFETVYGPTYE